MLSKFISGLLGQLAGVATRPIQRLSLTLQRDNSVDFLEQPDSTHDYIVRALYLGVPDGELELLFFTTIENDRDNFLPYRLGEPLEVEAWYRNATARPRFRDALDLALKEGDGKMFSLVVVCFEFPETDFEIAGIKFKYQGHPGAFRAWPLILFIEGTTN